MPERRRRTWPWMSVAGLLAAAAACGPRSPAPGPPQTSRTYEQPIVRDADVAVSIRALLAGDWRPSVPDDDPSAYARLRGFYALTGNTPAWTTAGALTADGRDATALLRSAGDDGLDPADYGGRTVLSERQPPDTADAVAALDIDLSAGMLRYFHDLHVGRVDPRVLGFRRRLPPDRHDFVSMLARARAQHRLLAAAADLRPGIGQYTALRQALTTYRRIAASAPPPLPALTAPVHPGEFYASAGSLRQRLMARGDLPAGLRPVRDDHVLDAALSAGLRAFQARHGLTTDGVLGSRTLAALNVPLAWRVRQIELALERLRWLPDLEDERLIAINIPMFRLWAWNRSPAIQRPSFETAVVVGQAADWQTPVFEENLREVVFRPYWNVPRSILLSEILPKLGQDRQYLARENFEIVVGSSDGATPVGDTDENIERLQAGALRLRQRPGPTNALGLVKFIFPNGDDIYMHATPSTALFSKSRRDFSHGCVRVEDAAGLAAWVLGDRPEWNRAAIDAAMAGASTVHVTVERPIRVILFYTTAAVLSSDDRVHFAEDIYHRDPALDRALSQLSP
jgi:L,D-transpeptidase YcbB